MNDLRSPETLALLVNFAALGTIVLLALWGWVKRSPAPELPEEPVEDTVEDLSKLSPRYRYALWREELTEWTNYDGTSNGLEELLDRWHGIPHEKPAPVKDGYTEPLSDKVREGIEKYRREHSVDGKFSFAACLSAAQAASEVSHGKATLRQPFQVGQWVRRVENKNYALREGLFLWRILEVCERWAMVECEFGKFAVDYADIEPALPRRGEWWKFSGHREFIPFKISECHEVGQGRAHLDSFGLRGELIPVNFGRGEEGKG